MSELRDDTERLLLVTGESKESGFTSAQRDVRVGDLIRWDVLPNCDDCRGRGGRRGDGPCENGCGDIELVVGVDLEASEIRVIESGTTHSYSVYVDSVHFEIIRMGRN